MHPGKMTEKYKQRGLTAVGKELDKLHQRTWFPPMDISKLTLEENQKSMEALMFLTGKIDKSGKGQMDKNGKLNR